jgi:hypothetical protein
VGGGGTLAQTIIREEHTEHLALGGGTPAETPARGLCPWGAEVHYSHYASQVTFVPLQLLASPACGWTLSFYSLCLAPAGGNLLSSAGLQELLPLP